MTEQIELINAVAALLQAIQWPLVALIIGLLFRTEISLLLKRAKSWKLFGLEGEFSDLIEQLADRTVEAEGATPGVQRTEQIEATEDELDEEADTIIRLAAVSPRAALMQLGTDIEDALLDKARSLMMASDRGLDEDTASRINMREATRFLVSNGALPHSVSDNIARFREIRNRVVHGGEGSEEEIFSAIDSGLSILRHLGSIAPPPRVPDLGAMPQQDDAAARTV